MNRGNPPTCKIEEIGSIFPQTKLKYTWLLCINNITHTIEFLHSKITQKLQVFVNGAEKTKKSLLAKKDSEVVFELENKEIRIFKGDGQVYFSLLFKEKRPKENFCGKQGNLQNPKNPKKAKNLQIPKNLQNEGKKRESGKQVRFNVYKDDGRKAEKEVGSEKQYIKLFDKKRGRSVRRGLKEGKKIFQTNPKNQVGRGFKQGDALKMERRGSERKVSEVLNSDVFFKGKVVLETQEKVN